MQEILSYLLQQSDEQLGKQIDYILQQLEIEEEEEESSESDEGEGEEEEEEEFDDEDDYVEGEGDDMEYFDDDQNFTALMAQQPCGEEWLSQKFITGVSDALSQTMTIQSKIKES